MDDVTRQQRRKIERDQAKLGRFLLGSGLSAEPRRGQMIVITRVLAQKLGERGNMRRASEAAGMAQALVEASLEAHPPKVAVACRKGCSYCCHLFVSISAPEAFRLADAVRASRNPTLEIARVRERCQPLRGIASSDRVGRKLPCPVLVDGVCGCYADRPAVCRQTTSLSLPACIDEYDGVDTEGKVEVSAAHLAHAGNAAVALLGALMTAELPTDAFELSAALELALANPDAEPCWLAGEDVFKALPRSPRRPASIDMVAARLAEALRG